MDRGEVPVKKFRLRSKKAVLLKYQSYVQSNTGLFIHWQKGITYWLNNKSRVKGNFHARICERLKLQCFGLLDRIAISQPAQSRPTCVTWINVPWGAENAAKQMEAFCTNQKGWSSGDDFQE